MFSITRMARAATEAEANRRKAPTRVDRLKLSTSEDEGGREAELAPLLPSPPGRCTAGAPGQSVGLVGRMLHFRRALFSLNRDPLLLF